jgi:hypothetical protein
MSSETSRPVAEGFAADSAAPGDDAGALERPGASVRLVEMCGNLFAGTLLHETAKINTPVGPKPDVPDWHTA